MKTLFLGLGNTILSDDGIGIKIVEDLNRKFSHLNTDYLPAEIDGLHFLDVMEGYKKVFIVDAFCSKDVPLGEVLTFSINDLKKTIYSKTANTTWRKPVDEAEWFSRKNTKVFLRTRAEQKYYGCKPIDFYIGSPHSLNLASAMEVGRKLGYSLPEEIIILGINVKDTTTFSGDLSNEIERIYPEIFKKVLSLVKINPLAQIIDSPAQIIKHVPSEIKAKELRITGIVQGVGFRPFIYSLAKRFGLKGFVLNDSLGVLIRVEGGVSSIDEFINQIKESAPPQSRIEEIQVKDTNIGNFSDFIIKASEVSAETRVMISPDIATCLDCRKELKDPKDYRFLYPFINCTNCGPRLTIIEDVPYDRIKTSMKVFKMCPACQGEYDDPSSRRFHAQPNACGSCGPRLELLNSKNKIIRTNNIIKKTAEILIKGKIVAVKGLGGYHLACNATDDEAVRILRRRKYREDKPFALMAKNTKEIEKYCHINEAERKLLKSCMRPIVLLEINNKGQMVSRSVGPGQKYLGFMLPYTPFHYLLFEEINFPIVLTSGNVNDEPIAYKDTDAFNRLDKIADYFLTYNREIKTRCDDSVARIFDNKEMIIRRARGYAPAPLILKRNFKKNILACGSELKNTFAIGRDNQAIISHHIGDLENFKILCAYEKAIEYFKKLFYFKPEVVAHDLHPRYLSTQYAQGLCGIEKIGIQHHHAHIASCMAENNLDEKVIGVSWDGTGFGADFKLWGSEFMIADFADFNRMAHINYIPLPGGEEAIKEPWRVALAYLYQSFGEEASCLDLQLFKCINMSSIKNIIKMIKGNINSPLSCGIGRLFDAVSAIIGIRLKANYEAQAAVELEMQAQKNVLKVYNYDIDFTARPFIIKTDKMIREIVGDKLNGIANNHISAKFHNTLARILLLVCSKIRNESGLNKVVLSGGVFGNIFLLNKVCRLLEKSKLKVYTHSKVPSNDAGISLGQLLIANRNIKS